MMKLKKLIQESTWGKRAFGEKLPTLDDYIQEYEEHKVYTDKDKPPFQTENQINEIGTNVSSKPFKAWKEHDDMNDKLYRDLHWATKAFPNKKKEIKKLMKLSAEKSDLIKIIMGQAFDL